MARLATISKRTFNAKRQAGATPQPTWVEPMKTLLVADVPPETGTSRWVYEIKWDGVRALAFNQAAAKNGGGSFHLFSRNHLDATFRYPEIAELHHALGRHSAILDGEIIALDAQGEPSFPILQKRMNVTRKDAVDRAAKEIEVSYVIFDILALDGKDLRALRWDQRRERLETLAPLLPPACRLSPVHLGSVAEGRGGEEMLEIARQKNLEGIVGKRIDSIYEEGQRSGSWVKIKLVQRQELVVGGWVPEVSLDGKLKPNDIGAVLLGYYEAGGRKFHLAGAVGTGFNNQSSAAMVQRLKPLHTATSPFDEDSAIRRFRAPIQWVKPQVIVEVEYRRWPAGGLMHQAAFKGIRTDKRAKDVVRELPAEPPTT